MTGGISTSRQDYYSFLIATKPTLVNTVDYIFFYPQLLEYRLLEKNRVVQKYFKWIV